MLVNVDDTMIYDDVGDVMMMVMMIMMIMLMMNIIHMKYTRFGPSCCRRMRHACMMQTHGVHATHTHTYTHAKCMIMYATLHAHMHNLAKGSI